MGLMTLLACGLACLRITGLGLGLLYASWAGGTLAALLVFLAGSEPGRPLHVGLAILATAMGGAIGAIWGALLVSRLFEATPSIATMPEILAGSEFPSFGGQGAIAGLTVGILAYVMAWVSAWWLRRRQAKVLIEKPTFPDFSQKQVLICAVEVVLAGWLLLVIVILINT